VQEQSRRHGYLLHLLGIRQIAVLINKMDLADYAQERYREIAHAFGSFLQTVGVTPACFIPIAAKHGDNIAARSAAMSWWQGPTVLEALDQFEPAQPPTGQPLRFPIQDIYRFDHRRVLAGRIEAGTLHVGDRLVFSPTNKVSTVKTIERWNAPASTQAEAGESIGVTLTEQVFVERGAVGALETDPPYELSRFKARLFWMGRAPMAADKAYKLKLATQEVECQIEAIERVLDSSTLETLARTEPWVGRNEVAELTLRTKRPIAFDTHAEIIPMGRFVIVDGLEVSGGGIITADNYPRRSADSLQKSHNIYWSHGKVTMSQRALRNGHLGRVVWLTGLGQIDHCGGVGEGALQSGAASLYAGRR
jgi:bifunctional enzyme CysN/CysC